jgi:hypothetical protein
MGCWVPSGDALAREHDGKVFFIHPPYIIPNGTLVAWGSLFWQVSQWHNNMAFL